MQKKARQLSPPGTSTLEKVEIRWPNGKTETLSDVPADAIYTVVEGSGIKQTTPLPPVAAPAPKSK